MAAEEEEEGRRLVIAVEGTAVMGQYWPAILGDYVEKIVRSFCASELLGKKLAGPPPELALVVFQTCGPYSSFGVQRSGWTKDINAFLSWLSGISFTGGGLSEAATCEGLTEALMILHGSRNTTQNNQNQEAHKHCILIAASNPYPLPTPVYRLPIRSTDHRENIESPKEPSIADAETFAKLFPQWSVSLSVISLKQLPTLKAIYNAGKRNPHAADPPVDHAKNPQFLVLLSENFMEACTALSPPLCGNLAPNQTKLKMDSAFANPSESGPMIGCKPVGVVGISTATVEVESATIPAMISSSQLGQAGVDASGLGPAAISSVPAMTPTPGMAQQTGANLLCVTNSFDINMPIGQHPNAQQTPSKFVKIWEGTLTAPKQGQSVFICKLEGFRSGAASEKLAADWPDTLQIVTLINQQDMNNKKYAGMAEFLVFRSLSQHNLFGQLKKKKLCAVIQLPSQSLLLSVSGIEDRLIGILFPGPGTWRNTDHQISQHQIQQPQAVLLQQPLHQKQHQQS